MTTQHFIIATAGHVDHGKSALVKALTGTDPDRLPEEKARKITIDLGFAELNVAGPSGGKIHAGIIDVPGHEDFVRNMIAGVGSIDFALFAVAADDGWMPQTEEHLQILSYLGVQSAMIALTKSDLGDIDAMAAQIREQLHESPFASAQIIPTSTRTGEGIENLKNALAAELGKMAPQRDFGKPRLFIDRVFTLRGIGTVVTGTLTGGKLRRGQSVVVEPGHLETRIRSIQNHGSELECAEPGMRTAINLPDVAIDHIRRGNVITSVDLGPASSAVSVRLEISSRIRRARRLKNGTSVYLHHGTSRVAAKVLHLQNTDTAQVRLASPIFAFLGDRFVLRDGSERHTIAGGVILGPRGDGDCLLSVSVVGVEACAEAEIVDREFVQKRAVLTKSHFGAKEIAEAIRRLESRSAIVVHGEIAASAEAWRRLRRAAMAMIDDAHNRHPERVGLDLNKIRAALRDCPAEVFDALVVELCIDEFVRRGPTIARATHQPALPAELAFAEARVREVLSQKPFDPPARKEIAQDGKGEQVIRFLIEAGELIEIDSNIVLLRDSFEQMKTAVVNFLSKNGPATVSELRQAMASSRRIIVPFLEGLDRESVTRRVGDKRRLCSSC